MGFPRWGAILLMLLAGCGKPRRFEPMSDFREPSLSKHEEDVDLYEAEAVFLDAPAAPRMMAGGAPKKRAAGESGKYGSLSSKAYAPSAAAAPPVRQTQNAPRPVAKRMVQYSGSATLRSTEPERIIDSAISVVKAAGGYLEQRSAGFAALRVPSQDFDTLFLRVMRLAQVIDYSQDAEDITEAVTDTELRLKVVVSTLERMEELVKKARTEAQKLRLLAELKRLREEREVLESRMRDLVQRARFASIHLRVEIHAPWAGESWRQDIGDFLWINKLTPFEDARFRGRSTVKFRTPEGMVVSHARRPWRATSSQGSEFWGSELKVDPIGDSRFWRESIRSRLGNGFKAADTAKAGAFDFCSFKSFGPKPYYYWVGVRSLGRKIELAEFYFPDEGQQAKLLPGLLASVERKSE